MAFKKERRQMNKYIEEFNSNKKFEKELQEWKEQTKGLSLEEKVDLVLKRYREADIQC